MCNVAMSGSFTNVSTFGTSLGAEPSGCASKTFAPGVAWGGWDDSPAKGLIWQQMSEIKTKNIQHNHPWVLIDFSHSHVDPTARMLQASDFTIQNWSYVVVISPRPHVSNLALYECCCPSYHRNNITIQFCSWVKLSPNSRKLRLAKHKSRRLRTLEHGGGPKLISW